MPPSLALLTLLSRTPRESGVFTGMYFPYYYNIIALLCSLFVSFSISFAIKIYFVRLLLFFFQMQVFPTLSISAFFSFYLLILVYLVCFLFLLFYINSISVEITR